MPKLNDGKQIAHALAKLVQGQRLIREAERDLRGATRALRVPQKKRTGADPVSGRPEPAEAVVGTQAVQ